MWYNVLYILLYYCNSPFTAGPTVTIAPVTHINASAVRVDWTSYNLPKARIITGYTLKYTATATGSTFVAERAALANHAVLSGLMPYTEYSVVIRMRTEHGEGKWSNTSQFMTLPSGQWFLRKSVHGKCKGHMQYTTLVYVMDVWHVKTTKVRT